MLRASMNCFPAIACALAVSSLSAAAGPKFALVRIRDLYAGLPSTNTFLQQIRAERDEILKNERAEQLRRNISELQMLQAQLADKSKPLDEEAGRKLAQTYELKRQEAQTIQQEFESFKAERDKEINRRMVAGMRASLTRIQDLSTRIAKERGFDLVIDSSGNTNTGVPFVLYSKAAPDLTADVEAALKDSEPAAEKPVENAPASP